MDLNDWNKLTDLDPELQSDESKDFEARLKSCLIGQDRAANAIARAIDRHSSGLRNPNRPLGVYLFLGPTGSGKTESVIATSLALYGKSNAFQKINGAEFKESHETAKLVGAPPGYLGHDATSILVTQKGLDEHHTDKIKISILLIDEIEKAHRSFYDLLLSIFDKGDLTTGTNAKLDFRNTLIIMTSNLGAFDMNKLSSGSIGFLQNGNRSDDRIYRIGVKAAHQRFSPEFIGRIDKIVVFRTLTEEAVAQILIRELALLQYRIIDYANARFAFECSVSARQFLLREGYSQRFGARDLKRAIDRFITNPFSNFIRTHQVADGDKIFVYHNDGDKYLSFKKLKDAIKLDARVPPPPPSKPVPVIKPPLIPKKR